MKKAFVITSAIEVDNNYPLTYSTSRTAFSNAERFKHTIFTIACLDLLADQDTTLFLVDISENFEQYKGTLGYQKNLRYISVKEEFPEIFNTVRTHANKSHCEALILSNFFIKYRKELETYDYFFKMSGRYFLDSNFDASVFDENNTNKIFFKKPMKFEWNEGWRYEMVDLRASQGDNYLYQYCSVIFGFGRGYLDQFIDIFQTIAVFTGEPEKMIYDVETLLFYFTREFKDNIIETDWIVYGWDGAGGTFLRY
jgi:hypothetical protein